MNLPRMASPSVTFAKELVILKLNAEQSKQDKTLNLKKPRNRETKQDLASKKIKQKPM